MQPLTGIRVIDLTQIYQGPYCAFLMAMAGAEIIKVEPLTGDRTRRRNLADIPPVPFAMLNSNKRSITLNLQKPRGVEILKALVKDTDVFSQGYRPGMLQGLGFSPEDLAETRPGIVYLSISCYGADGPFSHRAGWEQVAQTMTGICHEGSENGPALLPAAACDYTTGYLGAYGVLLALARRAREGGSYHVRVSLCQSGMFIYRQGQTGAVQPDMDLSADELATMHIDSQTADGPLRHLGPVLNLSETAPHWTRPTPVLGGDRPEWLDTSAAADAAE